MDKVKWEDAILSAPQVARGVQVFVTDGITVKIAKMVYGKYIPDFRCKASDVFGRYVDIVTGNDVTKWVTHWSLIPSGKYPIEANWKEAINLPEKSDEPRMFMVKIRDDGVVCAEFINGKFHKHNTFFPLGKRVEMWTEVVSPYVVEK